MSCWFYSLQNHPFGIGYFHRHVVVGGIQSFAFCYKLGFKLHRVSRTELALGSMHLLLIDFRKKDFRTNRVTKTYAGHELLLLLIWTNCYSLLQFVSDKSK